MKNFSLGIVFLFISGCTHHEIPLGPTVSKIQKEKKRVLIPRRNPASVIIVENDDPWLDELINYEEYHRLKKNSVPYSLIKSELQLLRAHKDQIEQLPNLQEYVNKKTVIGGVYKSSRSQNFLAQVFFGKYEAWVFLVAREGRYDLELGREIRDDSKKNAEYRNQ